MTESNINKVMIVLSEKLSDYHLMSVKESLKNADDSEVSNYIMMASQLKDPTTALLLTIFLAGGRAYIGEVWKTVVMWLLILFCGIGLIWWLIDIFQIQNATRDYNMKQLTFHNMADTVL